MGFWSQEYREQNVYTEDDHPTIAYFQTQDKSISINSWTKGLILVSDCCIMSK